MASTLSRCDFLAQHITDTTAPADEPNCPICLEPYADNNHFAVAISGPSGCKHVFGASCIHTWLCSGANTCPMCRRVLYNPDYTDDQSFEWDDLDEENIWGVNVEEDFDDNDDWGEEEEIGIEVEIVIVIGTGLEIQIEIQIEMETPLYQMQRYQHTELEEPPSALAFFQITVPLLDLVHHPIPSQEQHLVYEEPHPSITQWPISVNTSIQVIPASPHHAIPATPRHTAQPHQEQHIEQEDTHPATNQRFHWLDRFFQDILPLPPLVYLPVPATPRIADQSRQEQERDDTRLATNPSYTVEDAIEDLIAALLSVVERALQRAADARLAIERLEDRMRELLPYSSMR